MSVTRSSQNMKMQTFVMPAWIVGTQARGMRPTRPCNLGSGSPCRNDELVL